MNRILQRKRILFAIYGLPKGDVKKLKGNEYYRLRIGDIRVIFTKNDKELIILVIDIGNRGQVYEGLLNLSYKMYGFLLITIFQYKKTSS
ncbi:type II toxin-antitoxin system RelE/ParE family toxin [Tepidibacillus sp. HK-1]|uniref:type II toxin-antitoxin system RelE/ParE family toxin n=1 Tax=Tepidibacillus sp. HK-1 TaxID=1883407 RepID=UPI0037D9F4FD